MTPLEEMQRESKKEVTVRRQLYMLRELEIMREVQNGSQKKL